MATDKEIPIAYPGRIEKCCVCEKTYFSCAKPGSGNVCASIECIRTYKSHMQLHSHSLNSHFNEQSKNIQERKQQELSDSLRIAEDREKEKSVMQLREEKANQEFYNDILKGHSDLNNRQFPLVTLTSYLRKEMVELSEERKQNYLRHIRKLIDAVESESESESELDYDSDVQEDVQEDEKLSQTDIIIEENEQQFSQLNGEICRVCAGRCCIQGADRAYLKEMTIKRYMSKNPELSFDQVFANYEQTISEQTYNDSCINHTDQGCNLPREMRSDTCNNFYCNALKKLENDSVEKNIELKGLVVLYRLIHSKESEDPKWSVVRQVSTVK